MLNNISIMGRLTADPELKHTPNNVAVCAFTIAVERDTKDKTTGERTTDFIDCVAWRNTAELLSKYFSKGRMVAVKGALQTRFWEDKNGNKRKAVEIRADSVYFADSKKEESSGTYNTSSYEDPFSDYEEDDGECPF